MYVKGGVDGSEAKSDDGKNYCPHAQFRFDDILLSLLEGAKEEEEETEKRESQSNEKCSENIEMIDIEMDEAIEKWKKQKDQIPATPIFHGGE